MCIINLFETPGDFISTLVLVIILGVLIFYTIATFGLKKATVKQNELRLRPCIIIEKVKGGLNFNNIGHSHALNVNIDILETDTFRVHFSPHNLVKAGQSVRINYKSKGKDPDAEAWIQAFSPDVDFMFISEAFPKDEYVLKVNYENMEKMRYYTLMRVRVSQEKIKFIETGKA